MLDDLKTALQRPYLGLAAAGVAYYGFLAIVPLLASALLLFGLLADSATLGALLATVTDTLPGPAGELVGTQMLDIAGDDAGAQGIGLLVSLLLSLIAARGGALALIDGLDLAFKVNDSRSFVRRNLLAVAITVGAILGMGLVVLTLGYAGLGDGMLGKAALYLVLFAAVLAGASILYRKAPDREGIAWIDTWPGAALFAAGMLAGTLGFGIYVAKFGDYDATYGSLGAIVVLLTWMWLSAYLLLIGAAFNASRWSAA